MKKQVLSLAMTASMLAALAPLNVLAADDSTVTFEENLYYNDFSENMDGLTELVNSKSDTVSVVDGKLKFDLKNQYSIVKYTIDGSEDWEEYTVLAKTDIQGTLTSMGSRMQFFPKATGETSSDDSYGWLVDSNGDVNSPVGNKITAWNNLMAQGMYTKVHVNKNTSWYYSYPITQNPTEEYLDTAYANMDDTKKSKHTTTHTDTYGKFAIAALYDTQQVYVDELQVKDLRAKAAVTSAATGLSAGDTVTIKFSEAMSTETLTASNFYLTDGTNTLAVSEASLSGDDGVVVTIPNDAEEGVTYTLVAKKEIKDADGDRLNNDKKFEIKMAGEPVTFEEKLYYNDFSENMNGLTISKNAKNNNVTVENGKLKVEQNETAHQSAVHLTLDGSGDWEEYSLETTAQIMGKPGYIYFYPEYTDTATGASYMYMIFTDGSVRNKTNSGNMTSAPYLNNPVMKANVDVTKTTSTFKLCPSSIFTSWSSVDAWGSNAITNENGKMVLNVCWGNKPVYIDDIKVVDLRAKAAVTSAATGLSAGDTVTIKFSEAMNTETLTASNFYLTDGTTQIDVKKVDVTGNKTVAVTIPDDAEEGTTYTLVAKKEIKDADGDRLNNDKKFEIKMAGDPVTFEENLYYNDFSENMDGLTQIKNDKEDTVSVVDGKLQFDLKDTYSVVGYEIDGSDGWEEYNVLLKTKMETDAATPYTRFDFYPRYKADGETADTKCYEWFVYKDLSTVNSPADVGNGSSWLNIIDNGMYTKINVNKNTSHYYSYPLLATTTEATLDNGLAEKASDTKYNKTHTTANSPFVIVAKWAAKKAWVDEIKVVDLRAKAAVASDVSALEAGDKITVKFSEAMDTATFTKENVYFKAGEETVAPAAVSEQGAKKMIITVPEDLLSGEDYTLVIKKEVTDAGGDRMNTDKAFAVKTAKAKFNILSTSPAHGEKNVSVLSDVAISFDGNIDYEKESEINLKITDGEGKSVAHSISHAQSTATRMYVMFPEPLEPATEYHVEISGVKSTEGYKISGVKKFSFTTKEAGADYLYTNDFSDPATISDFEITKGMGTETAEIKDGVLVLNANIDNTTSGYDVKAKLVGSDSWSDYEVEMDIKGTSQYQYPYITVRGGTATETLTSAGEPLKSSFTNAEQVDLGSGSYSAFRSAAKKLVIRAEGNNFTVTYDGKVIHEATGGSDTAARGAITLANKWNGSVAIDNLKVKDLGISAYVKNPKNVCEGDEIFVVFDREMNTDTLTAEHVSVAAASDGAPVKISTRVVDGKTLAIKLPYGIASNELYTITLTQEIASKNGIYLATEKKLEVKAAEKDFSVDSLKLISGGTEVEALQKNTAIAAQAHFKNSTVSDTPEKAVLVMAVYNADGGCVAIKTKPVSLERKTDNTFETESFTLPENIEGYSVKIICVDSLENIKPMIVSREY